MQSTETPGGSGSIANALFQKIWGMIIAGELKPGQRLTEQGLCDQLDASRTPVRQAMHHLEMTRLVTRKANRGLYVSELSIEEMVELSAVREVLEGLMARQAAMRFREGRVSLTRLEKLVGQMRSMHKVDETEILLQLGDQFHQEIRNLSCNKRGAHLLEQVLLGLERYRHLIHHNTERAAELIRGHSLILQKIAAGDADAAESTMRNHIRQARLLYRKILGKILPPEDGMDRPAR